MTPRVKLKTILNLTMPKLSFSVEGKIIALLYFKFKELPKMAEIAVILVNTPKSSGIYSLAINGVNKTGII